MGRNIICRFDRTRDARKKEGQQLIVAKLENEKTLFENFLHALSTASDDNLREVMALIRQSDSIKTAKLHAHEWVDQTKAIRPPDTGNVHIQDPNTETNAQKMTKVEHQPNTKVVPINMLII
jgi:hypothetical protein